MKLYTFEVDHQVHIGAERDGRLIALPQFADMLALIRGGTAALESAHATLNDATQPGYALDQIKLHPPIPQPGKVLCSGVNYHSHFLENPNAKMPGEPFFFAKLPNAVTGPGQPIVHPKLTQQLDYEVEFAVVIGRTLHNVAESEVMAGLFGYTVLHDVSARDVQFKDNQITLGKNFDGFAPIGPCIVTVDEIPHPETLALRSYVNGELRQNGSKADWVFTLPRLISALAAVMTLQPGDVISTGTPAGVGAFRTPPAFLKAGDRVAVEVESIGRLENYIVADT